MSDNNRIIDLNKKPDMPEVPLKLDITHEPGFVKVIFDPAVTRMRMQPRMAREIAISLLIHADKAEYPPSQILTPEGQ